MVAVARPDHPLTARKQVRWRDLAQLPCVLPPSWASLRVKLEQQFHREGLDPPVDIVETASFLAQVTFIRACAGVGFMARSVARHVERERLLRVLSIRVPVDRPPVGLITMRARPLTPVTEQLVQCIRTVSKQAVVRPKALTPPGLSPRT